MLQDSSPDVPISDITGKFQAGSIASIDIDRIEANPYQPRNHFEEEALAELSESIKNQGIIQPITVRKVSSDKYQLISGERRLRAAKMAGLDEIPAYIRTVNDEQMLEFSLVENIQRENLNPIEIAISYQRLIEECSITQEELSERVGKKRTTITNAIRLLKLPAEIQVALRDSTLSTGHARALIGIEDKESQLSIFRNIIARDLSVREVEEIVRKLNHPDTRPQKDTAGHLPEKYRDARKEISARLQTALDIKRNNKGKGSIVIRFNSDKQLDDLLKRLG